MASYPIIANCNYESADDTTIHVVRQAVEYGLTDDANLLDAMDALEETLAEHVEHAESQHVQACRRAEQSVIAAWTDGVREAVEAERISRYRD